MRDFITFVNNGGTVAYIIVCLGIFGLVVIFDRVKVLYFDFALKTDDFAEKIKGYILANKIEDGIALCAAHEKAPLAYVVKGILERADRDDRSIEQAMDIRMTEVVPKLTRRFGYLTMLSNVATLMGLLGTIHGLIISFEAVSFADPAQKQTILTQGIAMYMAATALGLGVAIPVMFAYAFLHARQGRIMSQIIEHTSKVVDLLTSRNYEVFDKAKAYGSDGTSPKANGRENLPPAPTKRVS